MFLKKDPNLTGFHGLYVVQVCLFFSFMHNQIRYPCALVQWFTPVGDEPCRDIGMWMVEPNFNHCEQRVKAIVHLDTTVRGAHLLPVYSPTIIPPNLQFSKTLRPFHAYCVNKYVDHHMHQIAF